MTQEQVSRASRSGLLVLAHLGTFPVDRARSGVAANSRTECSDQARLSSGCGLVSAMWIALRGLGARLSLVQRCPRRSKSTGGSSMSTWPAVGLPASARWSRCRWWWPCKGARTAATCERRARGGGRPGRAAGARHPRPGVVATTFPDRTGSTSTCVTYWPSSTPSVWIARCSSDTRLAPTSWPESPSRTSSACMPFW